MKYSFNSRIRFSEVDTDLHITLPAILTYFQDCSTFHSESVGQSIDTMKKDGIVWILSSWQIIVDRYPSFGENVTISTWAYGFKNFMGYRNFTLTDEDGNVCACANTNWIFMDINKGRPIKISKEVAELYPFDPQYDMDVTSRKISLPKGGIPMDPILVRHADIDMNQHVNNEKYVLMAEEFLPKDFKVRQLRVEYKQSAKYGDTMYPVVHEENDVITVILNNDAGKAFATIEFTKQILIARSVLE